MTTERNDRVRVLCIGPLPSTSPGTAEPIGGSKLTFAETIQHLKLRDLELDIIDTARPRPNLPIWKILIHEFLTFARVIWVVLRRARGSEVVFLSMSAYSAFVAASTIWAICKVVRRPMALRFFGGYLGIIYPRYGPLRRWLADRTFLRCPLVFVESQQLCRQFGDLDNFRWMPNTRDIEAPKAVRRDKVNKLIFLARLEMDKGLAEALAVCRHLPENCHLNVFGPGMSDTDFSLFDDHPRATYGGVLEPAEVPRVLGEHDLLLFPSYYRGESYPGVIIEAFQCGVPVVATTVGGVPEMVKHEESGLLVEPRSVQDLKMAIERLIEDPGLYRRLCAGAKRRGEFFRSGRWFDRMAKDLRDLAATGGRHG